MKNRADIQWLRAVAVMMVVLFHLSPARMTGGFAGVDVFFVISGYLITTGLLRERPRLADFWLRRIRRLLPSALLVIMVTILAAFWLVPPGARGDFGGDAIASIFYFENWWLVSASADYFAAEAPGPFQHFWSLAVEEQFYLVWPLLVLGLGLWGAAKGSARRTRLVFGAVFVASLAWSIVQSSTEPTTAYLSTFTRAWEFAAGALIATGLGFAKQSPRTRRILSIVGFALIAMAAFGLNESMVFPGWIALWPVVGTGLVIAAQAEWSTRVEGLLRPARWIGDISYGLYLWHWPVVVIASHVFIERTFVGTAVMFALAIGLAWATKRFVEDPIRRSRAIAARRKRAQYFGALVSSLIVFSLAFTLNGATAAQLAVAQTAAERQALQPCFGANAIGDDSCGPVQPGDVVPTLDVAKHDAADPGSTCMTKAEATDVMLCEYGSQRSSYRVLLVGDSHAATLLPPLKLLAVRNNWNLTLAYHAGCTFSLVERNESKRGVACAEWNSALQGKLAAAAAYDLVITAGYAKNRLADLPRVTSSALADGLSAAWQPLIDRGSRVVAVRDNPEMSPSMKACWDSQENLAVDCWMPAGDGFVTDPAEQAAANTDSLELLDLTDVYCPNGSCPTVIGGAYVYRNADHISATYARSMTLILGKRLQDLLGGF
ncbi:MAG: hypothetical protein RL645_815 [Actinomycetota bacterium]|jgi:peptidoglycan/LPS O-acetylase OafA/YrhL